MDLVGKIKVITGNSDYRVKDVIDKTGKRWEHSARQIKRDSEYKNSILRKYLVIYDRYKLLSSTDQREHFKNSRSLLLRLIQEYVTSQKIPLPHRNELVVHLRMGDVVGRSFAKNKEIANKIVAYIDKYSIIQKVTLLTCFAYQDWSQESKKEYLLKHPSSTIPDWGWTPWKHSRNIDCFKILENDIRVKLPDVEIDVVSSDNIDDDMCYAVMADHFISSLGGFTELLDQVSIMRREKTFEKLSFLRPVDIAFSRTNKINQTEDMDELSSTLNLEITGRKKLSALSSVNKRSQASTIKDNLPLENIIGDSDVDSEVMCAEDTMKKKTGRVGLVHFTQSLSSVC